MDLTNVELIYKGFQENPTRLSYSTVKLQRQFNCTEQEVKCAKKLFRQNPKSFFIAQAECLVFDKTNQEYEDCIWSVLEEGKTYTIPANDLFSTLIGENDFSDLYKKRPWTNHNSSKNQPFEEEKWEVKQKWVKNKQTGESSLLVRKNTEDLKQLGEQIIQDMNNYSPKYEKIVREKQKEPHLLVLSLSDIHFGKLSVMFETGQEYNREIAIKRTLEGVRGILNKTLGFNIDTILLIIGNDILHTDTKNRTTTFGTPQDTEGMWHENFLLARDLYVKVIETLLPVADVYVQNCPSNHDEMSGFFLAETVKTWFRLNENVFFDITPKYRKYLQYGQNLIGCSHGDGGKEENLPLTMADEASEEWGQTKFKYWYLGHIHHKKSKEYGSVCVEYLRSPSPPDAWHDKNQFLNMQAMEGFIHSFDKGQTCRITHYF